MSNDNSGEQPPNIIPFRSKGGRPFPGLIGNPETPTSPKLPQDTYRFYLVDKVTGEELVYTETGHLVVTGQNIVLFNENQEMVWGIPNDDFVIRFERADRSVPDEELEVDVFPEDQ